MTTIVLNTDGPPSPESTVRAAEVVAEAIRALNHMTRDTAALEQPVDVDALLRHIATAVERLPQLLGQANNRLAAMREAGEIRVAAGEYTGRPNVAVAAAGVRIGAARMAAVALTDALHEVTALTWHLDSLRPRLRETEDG